MRVLPFLFVSLLILNTCKDGPTETTEEDKPGRRDYVWTVDTLSFWDEFFTLHGLWGASPNDIWAIAYAPSTNHSLWHYNGIKWEVKSNILLSSNLQGIYGFATNDIWIINGLAGGIYHYNGVTWEQNYLPYKDYSETIFNDIWGLSSSEIYIAGSANNGSGDSLKSFVLKYDGNNWNYLNIPALDVNFRQIRKSLENNFLYFSAAKYIWKDGVLLSTRYYVFCFDGNSFFTLYEGNRSIIIRSIKGEVYFVQGSEKKVYKHQNSNLVEWKIFSGTQYLGEIFGRSEIDFFTLGNNNTLLHYNGTDLQQIYQAQNSFNGALVLEKDIFLLSKGQYNYVIHGKLID